MDTLYDRLRRYEASDYYGFHMPGHKRNTQRFGAGLPYGIDITEIEGFDDLHHPSGILKECQEEASRLYGAEETRYLVNGSTAGILSAILGCTRKGDQVLVGRNCHKSVYHAIYMNELEPVYLYPGFRPDLQLNTELSVSAVQAALNEHFRIRAVILVSPTYDGVVSDIRGIAQAAHDRGIPLIVDEAHGAHFGFHPYFPESAVRLGADVVIHSLHKTLPALTQTAPPPRERTSGGPGADLPVPGHAAVQQPLLRADGRDRPVHPACCGTGARSCLHPTWKSWSASGRGLGGMEHLFLAQTKRYDRSRLAIVTARAGMSGRELYMRLLADYHLQLEMAAGSYALAMTSVGDTREGLERLARALREIDSRAGARGGGTEEPDPAAGALPVNEQVFTIAGMEEEVRRGGAHRTDAPGGMRRAYRGLVCLSVSARHPPGCAGGADKPGDGQASA